jgi:hypothetical protein
MSCNEPQFLQGVMAFDRLDSSQTSYCPPNTTNDPISGDLKNNVTRTDLPLFFRNQLKAC